VTTERLIGSLLRVNEPAIFIAGQGWFAAGAVVAER